MTGNGELIDLLEERASGYDQSGPSAAHTADLFRRAAGALRSDDAEIAIRDKRVEALEAERDFLLQEIAYCTERLRKAGVKDGITTEPKQ